MNWISSLFTRHARNIHLALVAVLSLYLIFGSEQVKKFIGNVFIVGFYTPFETVKQVYGTISHRAEELEQLHHQLTIVTQTLTTCQEQLRECNRLSQAQGFAPPPGYAIIPAKVIAIADFGTPLPMKATINKGRRDSVESNLPIINQNGLLGRVDIVMENYSSVRLLTDPANRVAARLARSREMGIIRYSPRQGMILDNFPVQGDVKVGDTVLSSGLGGIYPGGLIIGTVAEVSRPEHKPFCHIIVKPAANVRSLEEIFILKPE